MFNPIKVFLELINYRKKYIQALDENVLLLKKMKKLHEKHSELMDECLLLQHELKDSYQSHMDALNRYIESSDGFTVDNIKFEHGCIHEFPDNWNATIPPSCIKCGKSTSYCN